MHTLFSSLRDGFQQLPESDWLRFGVLLLVLLSALWLTRMISRVNRHVLCIAVMFGVCGLLASWVHNRNEPSFMTPVVEIVAPWFPQKIQSMHA